MVYMFSLIFYFNLPRLACTSFSKRPFFIFSSAILLLILSIFWLSCLLNSLKRSSCTVISFPDNILADKFSSSVILLRQLAFSFIALSVILLMGMQLYLRMSCCFHFAQSIFWSICSTYLRNLLSYFSIYDCQLMSVQNAFSIVECLASLWLTDINYCFILLQLFIYYAFQNA